MINSLLDFLHSDPEFKKLDEACRTHHEAACKAQVSQDKHMREYLKWNCCKGALEWFNMDVTDSGDLHFTGLNHELVGEYLIGGQQMFQRMKRAALVKAGHHAELWIKADEDYEEYDAALQQRRSELYDKHQELLREKRSAEQEAE